MENTYRDENSGEIINPRRWHNPSPHPAGLHGSRPPPVVPLTEPQGIAPEVMSSPAAPSGGTDWQALCQILLKELQGRPAATPETPAAPISASAQPQSVEEESLRLSEALVGWEQETERKEYTLQEWRTWIRRFTDVFGDLSVRQITKAQMREFKNLCQDCPRNLKSADRELTFPALLEKFAGKQVVRLSPTTINKGLTAISSILNWCIKNGYLETNPAVGVSVAVNKVAQRQNKRQPFSAQDLQAIFHHSPVYAEGRRPRGCGEAGYWIPVLGLYTGARLEELGKLQISDVREDQGIWYLDINADRPGTSVKTASSLRKIPLHPVIMGLGFLDYVDRIARRQSPQHHRDLFPLVKSNTPTRTSSFSKWFNKYLRTHCRITDPRKVFHSFRHTFKDACRDARIARDVHDALTGHADNSVSASYGSGYSLARLAEAVEKIHYPGLEIPRSPF